MIKAIPHLHYNVFERGYEAISGNFAVSARNCLTSTFKYIVMQTRKVITVKRAIKKLTVSTSRDIFKPIRLGETNLMGNYNH